MYKKREIYLSASMLCANCANLSEDIAAINRAGVSLVHVDIMDGHFVPNMTGGLDVANCIRKLADAPCDFHIMAEDPTPIIEDLQLCRGERLAFHVENRVDHAALIAKIKARGAKAGLAINPGTPLSAVHPYMDMLDFVLVLIVNPGFKGQPIIPQTLSKLNRLKAMRDEKGLDMRLLVDGAVTPENMMDIITAGADDIVGGPFTCFNQSLGGIEPTLSLVKQILAENNCFMKLCDREDR